MSRHSGSAILPPALLVCSQFHTGQRDDAQTVQRAAVGFLHAFGDEQRHRGIAELVADTRRHVDAVALLPRRLVLDRPAVA
jgi:hypothetical protein